MTDRQTTIFNQLILNIIVPTLGALMIMALVNFVSTKALITNSNNEKNRIISREITELLEFQELAISIIEKSMTTRMESLSEKIVNDYLSDTRDIEHTNLDAIRKSLGMDPETEDIYIIDRNGIIVNTTFKNDLGFNLFKLGEEHKNHLLHVFDTGTFVNTRFAVEASTNKPRKYTYQATTDRNYIVEIGAYSDEADEVLRRIEDIKTEIMADNKGIIDLEIFFMADTIFSFNKTPTIFEGKENMLAKTFADKDTISILEKSGRSWYQYDYLYMLRDESQLYKGSVMRIVSDRTSEKMLLRRELSKFIGLFSLTLLIVSFLIYRKTRVITMPIKNLVESVDRITGGHLDGRAEVVGNNEVTRLSEKFNMMIDELEKYYNELEQMVKDRTAEIEKQKLEIEAQRDVLRDQKNELYERNTQLKSAYIEIDDQKRHIMDSIYYARRIQTAILPSDDYIGKHIKSHFILYRPKDIVSGDFYWFHKVEGKSMIAAVDCTGHGVPGAFMSIVGYNQLNHAVSVMKARNSEDILNKLNAGVIQTLSENTHEQQVMDGMDLALLVFDSKRKVVEFSGANNPLVLVRDDEAILYKADKFPIGAYEGDRPQIFTRNEVELKEGDMLYIFSDGYADQFGGPDDKKFTTRKFREFLVEIHSSPVARQRELLNEKLEEWMGDNEQVDDILVIGIKI